MGEKWTYVMLRQLLFGVSLLLGGSLIWTKTPLRFIRCSRRHNMKGTRERELIPPAGDRDNARARKGFKIPLVSLYSPKEKFINPYKNPFCIWCERPNENGGSHPSFMLISGHFQLPHAGIHWQGAFSLLQKKNVCPQLPFFREWLQRKPVRPQRKGPSVAVTVPTWIFIGSLTS